MRSEDQKHASRTNGAKSNGPKTDAGKAASSRNGTRHNLASGHLVLLSTEDPDEYVRQREEFLNRFQPIDGVELDLVDRMLAASWREQRVGAMESALLELEMVEQRAQIDQEFDVIDGPTRQVLAFLGTADNQAGAALLLRYAANARRSYASAFRILRELQGDRFNRRPAAAPVQNRDRNSLQRQGAETRPTETRPPTSAPKVIVFHRRQPEKLELPSEPENALAAGHATPPRAS